MFSTSNIIIINGLVDCCVCICLDSSIVADEISLVGMQSLLIDSNKRKMQLIPMLMFTIIHHFCHSLRVKVTFYHRRMCVQNGILTRLSSSHAINVNLFHSTVKRLTFRQTGRLSHPMYLYNEQHFDPIIVVLRI